MSPIFTSSGPTLLELRTDVIDRGYASSTPGLDSAINSAYREIMAAYRWEFLETASSSLSLVADSASLSLGAIDDLLHIEAVRLDGTVVNEPELVWLPQQALRRLLARDTTTGTPCNWTQQGASLLVYPTPDQAYVLTIDYTQEAPDLVDDTDQAALPHAYMDAITWGAIAVLAFRQRDWFAQQTASAMREAAVQRMIRRYGLRQRQTSDQMQSNRGRWNSWNYRGTGF